MAKLSLFERRRRRVRTALKARAGGRPRLSVHRSGRHIYAQIIDDAAGRTVVAANSLGKSGATVDAAAEVGKALAEAAKRSEEHTSELQSLGRISYAVFCLDRKSVV